MLDPRWRKVLRDLWLHKARTLLVVLAIAIGITGAGAVLNNWALLRRVTTLGYLATNPASGTLHTDAIDAALLARVRRVPGVAEVQARRTVLGAARLGGGWMTASLFGADDFSDIRIHAVVPEEGRWPPEDDGIVVERSSAEFAGVSVGGSATLQVGDGPAVTLKVTGIARDAGLAPGWMEHVLYAFVTPATLERLGVPTGLDQLQFTVRDRTLSRAGVRRIAAGIAAEIERTGRRVREVRIPEPGEHIHSAQMDSLLFTQGAFGLLALLLSGFLVVNLMTAVLTGQVREIGVMKAIGARGGQLAPMYLVLALVMGLAACLIALPVAAAVGWQYARFSAELLNFSIEGFSIPAWAMLVQLAVGLLLPVAAAAIPVSRGCRISVGDALRDAGIDGPRGARPPGRLLSRVGGITRPVLLSIRNAFRRRQRMALTLGALAMGGAVYLGALNLRASIRSSVGHLYGEVMRFDLMLRLTEPHAADSIEAVVGAIPGAGTVEAWGVVRAAPAGMGGMIGSAFPVSLVPADSRLLAFHVDSGRWLRPGETTGLVVTRRLLEEAPDLALGRDAKLIIAGRETRWSVVGVVEAGPGPGAYATREALTRLGGVGYDRVAVGAGVGDEATQAELIRRVRSELDRSGFPVASGQLMAENRRVMEDHLLMVANFLLVMSQLMIVVGGLGLASTMSLSVLERTREIGVMRAIGARHRSIFVIVQTEALVIALLSWGLAIPLSLPMSIVLGRRFGRAMIPVAANYAPESGAVLWWLLLVLAVSIVATAWAAFRATRIPTARALAYE